MLAFRHVGYWPCCPDIELVNIHGKIYALNLWNGVEFLLCWECLPDGGDGYCVGRDNYAIRPVFRYEREGSRSDFPPGSPQWLRANEAVDFEIRVM